MRATPPVEDSSPHTSPLGDFGQDSDGKVNLTQPVIVVAQHAPEEDHAVHGAEFDEEGIGLGRGITEKVIWHEVKENARRAGITKLSPHDCRRTCARLCHAAGGELEQIQFLFGREES